MFELGMQGSCPCRCVALHCWQSEAAQMRAVHETCCNHRTEDDDVDLLHSRLVPTLIGVSHSIRLCVFDSVVQCKRSGRSSPLEYWDLTAPADPSVSSSSAQGDQSFVVHQGDTSIPHLLRLSLSQWTRRSICSQVHC